ncbi:MAG: VanZ family protein [Lachnospiraceae bacterium]|nr:VanZ family protein [Lachnospiraceae bacterium]
MNTWFGSIAEGMRLYINYGLPLTAPVMIIMMAVSKRFNPVEFVVKQMFILYLFCVIELVFFPLPTAEAAAGLSYRYQLIPLHFMADFMEDSFIRVLCQILLNVVMTIPFGMYLEYCMGMSLKKAAAAGFAFSLFIEVGQLTGLFFLFKGSYRLFDVDDLMLNTLGAVIGYLAIRRAIPSVYRLSGFNRIIESDT